MRKIIQYFNNVKFIKILILNSLISILLSYPYVLSVLFSQGFFDEPTVSERIISVTIQIFIIVIICLANYILYKFSKKHNLTQTANKVTIIKMLIIIIKMLIVLALIIILVGLFFTIPDLFLAILAIFDFLAGFFLDLLWKISRGS